MKFHMHGTDANKKAETFSKIKEDIISRIKRTFKDPLDVASSLKMARKRHLKNQNWVSQVKQVTPRHTKKRCSR